ncbi:MAG TPA: hypothetical protein ENK02_15650 [Planctomycetes bacterium]|nr:hypothetical protein [Planctomycetota bacterium]
MKSNWVFMIIFLGIFPFSSLQGQTRLFHMEGKSVKLDMTSLVRWAGDVNGDGIPDFCYHQTIQADPGIYQVRIFSGSDGSYLWGQKGYPGWEKDQGSFKKAAGYYAGIGDVDGDGRGDIVYLLQDFGANTNRVSLVLRSGRTKKVIYQKVVSSWFLPTALVKFLEVIGDVDGDGVKDVLLSTGVEALHYGVAVVSGKTGKKIRFHTGGPGISPYFGAVMRPAPDMDRDGVDDYLISSSSYGGNPRYHQGWGKVWLYSGKTGKEICTFELGSRYRGRYFGLEVSVVGDLDGDGWTDIGISEDNYDYGAVWFFSGKEAAKGKAYTLYSLPGSFKGEHLGLALAPLGDWDGDGRDDLAVYAATRVSTYPKKQYEGLVYLYSGKKLTLRKPFKVLEGRGLTWEGFGSHLRNIGDLDGDGISELLVVTDNGSMTITKPNYFEIWNHKHLALSSDRHLVSISGKGSRVQSLRLEAGDTNAGKFYLLLGSLSGPKPGFNYAGLHVPLNPDAYFSWTASQGPNALFLRSSFGVLDANGRASAKFILPPGIPTSLLWLRFWHAYLVFDSKGFTMASNPVPLLWDR